MGNKITMRSFGALRGLEKRIPLTFQRYLSNKHKNNGQGSLKAKINLLLNGAGLPTGTCPFRNL